MDRRAPELNQPKKYLLRVFDDKTPTHAICEKWLPDGEMAQMGGFIFVPPDLAARLGPPDDEVTFGAHAFPAWKMSGEMPTDDTRKA